MPCWIHGAPTTAHCQVCGREICARCQDATGGALCPHCAAPVAARGATPAAGPDRLLQEITAAAMAARALAPSLSADIHDLTRQFRQVTALQDDCRRLRDRFQSEMPALLAYIRERGLLRGLRDCLRDRRRAGQLLAETARILQARETDLRRELLARAEPEVSQTALIDALAADTRSVALAEPRLTVEVIERTAFLEVGAPADQEPRVVRETRRTRSGRVITTEKPRPARDVNRAYRDQVTAFARGIIQRAFDTVPGLEAVALSLFTPMIHPTLGHRYAGCVLAVLADRATWERIVHANVPAENALRNFALRFRPDDRQGLLEVAPIRPPGSRDGRGLDLDQLDPIAFEQLVSTLLTRLGYLTRLTRPSHDGGIDIIAENPQPVVGGKIIVQCKRSSSLVGVAAVRDLYGVVHAERATKGILVTTSDFSADARVFAEGKPIELIGGRQLADLLRQHGFDPR